MPVKKVPDALGIARVDIAADAWLSECRLSTVMTGSDPTSGRSYDAIVVGAGHNGLAAAFYLARAGLSTVALERRSFVGGCCVTEEFAPGYRASTGAYVLSMLREAIWRDMRLAQRGLTVSPAGPTLNLFPDGGRFLLSEDLDETEREVARFSKKDARRFRDFEQHLADMAGIIMPMFDWTPPTGSGGIGELPTAMKMGRKALGGRRDLLDLMFLFSTSATQYLDGWFESDHLKATMGWHAINDSVSAPPPPAPPTCCCTTTPARRPTACARGASCTAAWARSPGTCPTPPARPAPRCAPTPRSTRC